MNGNINGIGAGQFQFVSYGGVELPNCSMSFNCRAEYDSSNRILQGYAITFKGNSIVTDGGPNTVGFVDRLRTIEDALSRPRSDFKWTFTGVTVFEIKAATDELSTGWTDRRFGPKPRILSTRQITGGRSARIEFEIECFVTTTKPTSLYSQPTDFDELSWSFSYTFDRNFLCTRTISGVYRLRSPLNAAEYFLPDGTFFPSLPGSFYRDSFTHQLSADGTVLNFSVTDKEVWRTLPKPLTDGDVHFKIQQEGAVITKSLTASFTAPADINKRVILQFMSALVRQKFPGIFKSSGQVYKEWPTHFSLDDDQLNNRVSMQFSSRMGAVPVVTSFGGTTSPHLIFGTFAELGWTDIADVTPEGPDEWQKINGRAELRSMLGTANLIPSPVAPFNVGEGTATLPDDKYTPNATAPPLAGGPTPSGSGLPSTPAGPAAGGSGKNQLSEVTTRYSDDHLKFPYTVWEESVSYILDHHLTQIPVMASSAQNILQQTARSEMRIVQIGHARRMGAPVVFPAPLYVGSDAGFSGSAPPRISREERRPGVVRVLADGVSQEYEASWVYEVLAPNAHTFLSPGVGGDEGVNVMVPTSPIFADAVRLTLAESMQNQLAAPSEDGSYESYPSI